MISAELNHAFLLKQLLQSLCDFNAQLRWLSSVKAKQNNKDIQQD